jgi:hypothetical protein
MRKNKKEHQGADRFVALRQVGKLQVGPCSLMCQRPRGFLGCWTGSNKNARNADLKRIEPMAGLKAVHSTKLNVRTMQFISKNTGSVRAASADS